MSGTRATCGSHTHTISPDGPTFVASRLGFLDEDPGIRLQAHQFVAYASPFELLPDDDLPASRSRWAPPTRCAPPTIGVRRTVVVDTRPALPQSARRWFLAGWSKMPTPTAKQAWRPGDSRSVDPGSVRSPGIG